MKPAPGTKSAAFAALAGCAALLTTGTATLAADSGKSWIRPAAVAEAPVIGSITAEPTGERIANANPHRGLRGGTVTPKTELADGRSAGIGIEVTVFGGQKIFLTILPQLPMIPIMGAILDDGSPF